MENDYLFTMMVQHIMETMLMIKRKEKEYINIVVEMFMKENGKKEKRKEKEQ